MQELTFQIEQFKNIFDEALPLVEKHYDEIAHYKDIPLNPDIETYKAMEEAGILKIFTARKGPELVGYAVFIIKSNPHYRTSLQAVQDVIFIDPNHRGIGLKFIKWIDSQLSKIDNLQVIYHHVKAAYNFGPLLEHQGYELIDHIYGRRVN